MVVSLLVAQIVLLFFILLDGWFDLAPFNDLTALRKRGLALRLQDTALAIAPVVIAAMFTFLRLDVDGDARDGTGLFGVVVVAALALPVVTMAKAWWIPYWFGLEQETSEEVRARVSSLGERHAFLEPRQARGIVPSTYHCLVHAHVTSCLVMSLIVLLV